ncbi:MAG: DUF2919 family protein [Gammaproteobacteria bacterium]|jgi:hypothetical protein
MPKIYSFSDYDKYMALKMDVGLWLVIAYFLRPIILKIASLRMGRGGSGVAGAGGLKDMLYPNDFSFFVALVITIPAIIVLIAYAKRKPGAAALIQTIWHRGAILLMVTAVLNMVAVFVPLAMDLTHHITAYGWGQLAAAVVIFGYLYASERVKDTFADFPTEAQLEGRREG